MATVARHVAGASDAEREHLTSMLENMIEEGEKLLESAQRSGDENFDVVRGHFATQLKHARSELDMLGNAAGLRARRVARMTDRALHQHPYAAMGIAAVVAALLAAAVVRRR